MKKHDFDVHFGGLVGDSADFGVARGILGARWRGFRESRVAVIARLMMAVFCLVITGWAQDADPAQVAVGERLFLETRFSQFFAANSLGNANAVLAAGDPVLDTTQTTGAAQPGPFAGQAMNCRACHLVDEQGGALGNRTYGDFARRSPIPDRGDGHTTTPRNSPPLVNASLGRPGGILLHFDGEFVNGRLLAIGTLTGRNYGWLASERAQAEAHVAHIIRDDDGTGALAASSGGRYADLLRGTSPSIPAELRLPVAFRIDVARATDAQILNAVGRLIEAYMNSLQFAKDETGNFSGSPYDAFLKKNRLPRRPAPGEAPIAYARRLLAAIERLPAPAYVTDADGPFSLHAQPFVFGETELAGLKIFFTGPGARRAGAATVATGGAANCVTCHTPPLFTDFAFHNTGASQDEYDAIHGAGQFAALQVPALPERRAAFGLWLPPTARHPQATGVYAAAPSAAHPEHADLGLWNIFANPDHPLSQARILGILTHGKPASMASLLPRTIGAFKTPGLRDLGDSAPYLHHGQADTLEDVLDFYRRFSALAREGKVRNAAPELQGIALVPADVVPLAAFLRALDEDYE